MVPLWRVANMLNSAKLSYGAVMICHVSVVSRSGRVTRPPCSLRCPASTYLGHHASPSHQVRPDLCTSSVLALLMHNRPQQAVEMRILLVLVVSERFKALLQIRADRWWNIVVDARLIVAVLVV